MTPAPPNAESAAPAAGRRRGWRFLAIFSGAVSLMGTGLFVAWFLSDADVQSLRAELAAAGVATTWPELHLVASGPEVMEPWNRLAPLLKRLKSYERARTSIYYTAYALAPFVPVPDAARIHHADLDQEALASLRDCIDLLGDRGVVLRTAENRRTLRPEIGVGRGVLELLQEDALLADSARVAACCRRMLRFCAVQPLDDGIGQILATTYAQQTFKTIAGRLDDLKQTEPAIADDIAHLTDQLLAQLRPAIAAATVGAWTTWADRQNGWMGYPITELRWVDRALTPVFVRAGRAAYLRHFSNALAIVDSHAAPPAILAANEDLIREERRSKDHRLSPVALLRGMELLPPTMIITSTFMSAMYGRLLVAELRGQPWPEDWCDPAHGRLRALVRDGRMVGAYSVDVDGTDNAGKKPNHYYPLVEPLVPPGTKP